MATCKRCGEGDLHWREPTPGKWHLHEAGGRSHFCGNGDGVKREGPPKREPPSCKDCGAKNLRWVLSEVSGLPHKCTPIVPTAQNSLTDPEIPY